jgi:hypothetical protein
MEQSTQIESAANQTTNSGININTSGFNIKKFLYLTIP